MTDTDFTIPPEAAEDLGPGGVKQVQLLAHMLVQARVGASALGLGERDMFVVLLSLPDFMDRALAHDGVTVAATAGAVEYLKSEADRLVEMFGNVQMVKAGGYDA